MSSKHRIDSWLGTANNGMTAITLDASVGRMSRNGARASAQS
jgi:hypothetical protein